jgi:hypothetical protein
MERSAAGGEFTPLGANPGAFRRGARAGGNVIKSGSIAVRNDRVVAPVDEGEPDILVHREGDRIAKIEFTCRCGRTSAVSFDYD